MNIKKCSLKTMCAALACTTVLSSMLAAYATNTTVYETPMDDSAGTESIEALANDSAGADPSDSGWTTEENSFEDIKVTYQQSSSYTVTIPKTITLGTNKQAVYSVKVAGNIDANQRVYVAPVDGIAGGENLDFYMSDLSGKKEDVVATVTQNKTYWNSENVANAYEETNNSISAPDLTAGTWEGTFQVEIRLETEKEQEHVHDYVDGKCECGAVDPNHTHNYEDGTCTICGEKETDPYETAPAEAYSSWNYTLDDENNIITLNYYTGSETDVIVYENYPVEDKTYKTRIASNVSGATASTPYMFNGYAQTNCQNIETIVFAPNIDTSNVTDMSHMFRKCTSLTSLDVSNLDTSNVTNMTYMFAGEMNKNSIASLDLSGWDVSKVRDMSCMFYYCNDLIDLNLSGWDTSSVTNMRYMFEHLSYITSLDLSHFNTSNVTDMTNMFGNCYRITSINVGSFDTSKVKGMGGMFYGCNALTSLNLRNFNTRNVETMVQMFCLCKNLRSIYVGSDWVVPTNTAYTRAMFEQCGTSYVTR